jgi:hypothetical protein
MPSSAFRVVALALLFALTATAAGAQELAGSFDQLRVLLRPGDTVLVTDGAGREVRGTVADLSSSSLALRVGGGRRTFLETDIASIRQRRPDPLTNGAKWGFIVGAGLGVLGGITIASEYEGSSGTALIPMLALVYGGIGAGTGAGIDAMHSSEQVIYGRRGAPAQVTLRPILSPGRRGILASIAIGGRTGRQ